jgi:hypothetical protein
VARREADPVAVDLVLRQLGGDQVERPLGAALLEQGGADLGDLLPVGDAQDGVDALEPLLELGAVALGKAAGDDDRLQAALALRSTMESIVSMDSFSDEARKPQVLTTTTSDCL